MAFDFRGALKRANVAIGRILQLHPGLVGNCIRDAVTELSHPDLLMLPLGETRDAYESIFATVKAANLDTLTEDQAEEISTRIWAFRARCELECREARKQAVDQVVEEKLAAIKVPAAPIAPDIAPFIPANLEGSTLISVRIPVQLHRRLKTLCTTKQISMNGFTIAALTSALEADGIPTAQ